MNFLRNSIISNSAATAAAAAAAAAVPSPPLDDLPLDENVSVFGGGTPILDTGGHSALSEDKPEDAGRLRNRLPIQGHSDVPPIEGSVLIPRQKLPDDWSAAPDASNLRDLDRDFVFPGEQATIVVTISPGELPVPEIITPFNVAAVINKNALLKATPAVQQSSTEADGSNEMDAHESIREESQKKRSAQLLESFKNSHFYVKITPQELAENLEEHTQNVTPVLMEGNEFEPSVAGGMARRATASCLLANGDIAVVLQVAFATHANMENAIIEVLQYEQQKSPTVASSSVSDHSEDLLHWLLPLDRSSPFPVQTPSSVPQPSAASNTSTQRLSFATGNSTLFSFGHLRSSSQGALPPVTAGPLPSPSYPPSALSIGPEEWERLYPQKETSDLGNEGLLSFRGVPLEPQRFSANCGLEGLYVPGKRWRRSISVIQPLVIESYFADANTEDMICVLVENVLPPHLAEVTIFVDSISIICQSGGPGVLPQPVPVARVESGEDFGLPDLPLRSGEQHSFILRPTNVNANKMATNSSRQAKEPGTYAVVVACHCTHTQSRFYMKHSLKWKPRSARDLLISVSVENSSPTAVPNEAVPQLKSKVVTVQATNLSSKDLDLTLLTPSTMASSPVSAMTVPTTAKPRLGNSLSFHSSKVQGIAENEKKGTTSAPPSRSASLAPGRRAAANAVPEMPRSTSPVKALKERKASAADIAAESSSLRTHLWLQSTIPLGHVPAHSTTVVKCDLLPLTDGIISLDTLHIATKDHATVYCPENVLQIHSDCSITSIIT